ncbi:MAG: hypothetical protein JW945_08120, partial [Methanomicrobia archaeon]|nr:hypothetical protein [Methanomicrobia archaeon]
KVYVIETEKVAAMVRLPKSYAGVTDESTRGDIFVSSGYGASKRAFGVEIVESDELSVPTEQAGEEPRIPDTAVTEKKEMTLTADERQFLSRLVISACVTSIFFILVVLMLHVGLFRYSPGGLFVSALIAALLFLFLVLYNL